MSFEPLKHRAQLLIYCSASIFIFGSRNALSDGLPSLPHPRDIEPIAAQITSFYADELSAARQRGSLSELARRMIEDARNASNDELTRFAMLRYSQNLATEARDEMTLLLAADTISQYFDISRDFARARAIVELHESGVLLPKTERLRLANEALRLVRKSLEVGELAIAQQLADYASTSFRKARSFALYRKSEQAREEIEAIKLESQQVQQLRETKKEGYTAAESTLLGIYTAYVLRDWQHGLRFLQNCDDAEIRDLARRTLRDSKDAASSLAIARGWWEIAESLDGHRSSSVKQFAADYYLRALPGLVGINAKEAEERIADWRASIAHLDAPLGIEIEPDGPADMAGKDDRKPMDVDQVNTFTTFGSVNLPQGEIDLFIRKCRDEKVEKLKEWGDAINLQAPKMSAAQILAKRKLYDFLSQDKVIIVPRHRTASYSGEIGAIFKPASGSYSFESNAASAETHSILDAESALVSFNGYGPVVLTGIDSQNLPRGRWTSTLLLKRVESRKVEGVVGSTEVSTYQAVSSKGFPGDMLLW